MSEYKRSSLSVSGILRKLIENCALELFFLFQIQTIKNKVTINIFCSCYQKYITKKIIKIKFLFNFCPFYYFDSSITIFHFENNLQFHPEHVLLFRINLGTLQQPLQNYPFAKIANFPAARATFSRSKNTFATTK